MKIAVASGKGGTGKTTVAVNLAKVMASSGMDVTYVDCDVEEPNGHIFMEPSIDTTDDAMMGYPVIDEDLCTRCGQCVELCQYNAITLMADTPMVFKEMCHACGGCYLACPVGAINESERRIGIIEKGTSGDITFLHGKLDVGQVLSPPLIRNVKQRVDNDSLIIIDSPPGTSCPVVTSLTGVDYVLLVTEPTPFGLHDLKLAIETIQQMGTPCGVFINREDIGTNETLVYLKSRGIPVLGGLPDDMEIARCYARGGIIVDQLKQYRSVFESLAGRLCRDLSISIEPKDRIGM